MNWLHYLLEANLYLGVFYLGYYLFLSRETYYTLNRIYLLFSCVISFALPVLQLGILKPVEQPITAVNFTFPVETTPISTINYIPAAQPQFAWQDGLVYAYLSGAVVLLLLLLFKLYQLLRLTRVENADSEGRYKLVKIEQSTTAFSFFNYLFIGTKVNGPETIIKHELVHIRQKHSADIIFIELLKIVNWFNPVIYLVQYSLKTLHEYIADEKTAASGSDALTYSSFLVNNAYGIDGVSITNSFFNYNLLKKRIIMLNQKRSGSLARLKYLLAVPICVGLLCASTLAFSKTYGWVDVGPHRIDKNNHSPQVAEPVGKLLVTQHGTSVITDKFSYKRPDGIVRIYTARNISNKNIEDLKAKGIIINILSDVKTDTIKAHMAPPPAPPVKASADVAPKLHELTTSKGYEYHERAWEKSGKTDMQVAIIEKDKSVSVFDKNKATTAEVAMLKTKYGYTFPAHIKMPPPPPAPSTPSADRLPPPPPAPPSSNQQAPPPPPAPPVKNNFTSKGYKFEQDGYAVNGKTDFRVLITEKDGTQKEFYKSKATAADLKLLSDKYGYTFPEMQIYTRMPPPPPAPPASTKTLIYKTSPADSTDNTSDHTPVIIINGEVYNLKKPMTKGQELFVDASAGEHAIIYTDKDLAQAIDKYGPNAKYGVIFAFGKTTVTVK